MACLPRAPQRHSPPSPASSSRFRSLVLVALAVVTYGNTPWFDYALDDKIVITANKFTLQGIAGLKDIFTHDMVAGYYGSDTAVGTGGRYRPLALATHAIEYQAFGKNPALSHGINVLCYAATTLLLLALLRQLFPRPATEPWYRDVAFLGTAFFAVHPLHTEVVANIKGRDDLLSLLFGLGALLCWLRYVRATESSAMIAGCALLFLSLLSKEAAISFVAVGPLILWFFERTPPATILRRTVPLLATAFVYLLVRFLVVGRGEIAAAPSLMSNPFLFATTQQKFATIFFTWLWYLKLLFVPYPLTHDYYPYHVALVEFSNPVVIASLIVHVGLVAVLVAGAPRRTVAAFCIALYIATFALYSNLLFVVYTFMYERFLYVASLAFCLLLAWMLATYVRNPTVAAAVSVMVIAAGASTAFARNFAWRDDATLALTDVVTSKDSARAQAVAGYIYLEMADDESQRAARRDNLARAVEHLQASLRIHPIYFEALSMMASALAQSGRYPEALDYYARCFVKKPHNRDVASNVEYVAAQAAEHDDVRTAVRAFEMALAAAPSAAAYGALAEIYAKDLGDLPKARAYLEDGLRLAPDDVSLMTKLGIVYGMSGDSERAVELFDRAISRDPGNATAYLNKGMALRQMGNTADGDRFVEKALQIDPTLAGER